VDIIKIHINPYFLCRTYECDHVIVTVPLGVLKKSVNLFSPFLDADKVKSKKFYYRLQHDRIFFAAESY
jgi:hypothetical protein